MDKPREWLSMSCIATSVLQAVLSVAKTFSKDDASNLPVLDLSDNVVATWEAAGAKWEGAS
jgi:hypothetical protein